MISDKIFFRVIGSGFLIGGFVLFCMGTYMYTSWSAAQSWEKTDAILVSVSKDLKFNEIGRPGERRHRPESRSWRVYAVYKYRYDGREFEGKNIEPLMNFEFFEKNRMKFYKELKKVESAGGDTFCYVDPSNPKNAYLRREFRSASFWMLGGGALIFGSVGSLLWLLSFLRAAARPR